MFHHHIIGKITWAVNALVAVNIGLIPFGYDFFRAEMFMKNPNLLTGVFYFVGICGVYSLVKLVMHVMGYCNHCKK